MKAYCRDLGRMDYKTCWDLQQELFDAGVARKRTGPIPVPGADGADDAGTVLLVEHPPVYTLGKSGHAENLLIGRKALEAMGAQFFHTTSPSTARGSWSAIRSSTSNAWASG